ncbi:MAG: hypothetical protein M1816_004221 [Peltula sp. TS41687]|nr:MAG: hypothetical protein M1816_004221 [Peltula sp. TS41687]
MSEPIPESITTYSDPRSRRAVKKRALTPVSAQATSVSALFAHPDREVIIPLSATKEAAPKRLAPPPEIVANVQGSSAGAGSGEFHVYKAARRKEYERLRLMDEEMKREKEKEEFERRTEEWKKVDEAKTSRNKARREKAKARKLQLQQLQQQKEGKEGKMDVDEPESGLGPRSGVSGTGIGKGKGAQMARGPEKGGSDGVRDQREGGQAVVEETGVIIHEDD